MTTITSTTRTVRGPWASLAAAPTKNLFVLHLVNDGLQAFLLTALPIVAASLAVTQAQCGSLTAAHFAVGVFLALPATRLLSRFSGERLLGAGLAINGLCFVMLAMTYSTASLWVVFLLAGVGFGSFHPIAFALLAERTSSSRRSSMMGWFTALGDIGRVAIGSLLLFLAATYGWRGIAATGGVLAAAAGIGMFFKLGSQSPQSSCAQSHSEPQGGFRYRQLANADFICITSIGFFDALANAGLAVFLPFALLDAGVSVHTLTLLTGVFFTASIFGKAWMGTLADRFGNMKAIAMCQLANIVGILVVVYSNHFALLVAGVAVLGITNKGSLPAIMSKTSQSVSDSISRNAIGVNQLAMGVATTLSPLLYGIVSSYVGSGRLVCLAGIAVNAVALLLASVTGRDSM